MADKEVSVEHNSYSSTPLPLPDMGYGTTIHQTKITDSEGNTYTGVGWTKEESNDKAGEKYNSGDTD